MKQECAFCSLAIHTGEAAVVYEDEGLLAFMDRQPINRGHALVIPKSHQPILFDLEPATYGRVMFLVWALARSVQRVIKPLRVGLVVVGFDVPHAHVHVVPMHDYHDITSMAILENRRGNPGKQELLEIAGLLQKDLTKAHDFAI